MSTKQQLTEAISDLPDTLTIEEAVERLYRAFKLKQAQRKDVVAADPAPAEPRGTLGERLSRLAGELDISDLPADLAENHDRYAHGGSRAT